MLVKVELIGLIINMCNFIAIQTLRHSLEQGIWFPSITEFIVNGTDSSYLYLILEINSF